MEKLKDLFSKYEHTDKHTKHNYDELYEEWFSPLQDKPLNILEIGVSSYGGGDLLAFADYFPNSIIYGLDNEMHICIPEVKSHPKIKLIEGNAYDVKITEKLKGLKFDIIIDDCIHNYTKQMQMLNLYHQFLTDDGLYIIEDCHQDHLLLWGPIARKGFTLYPKIYDLTYARPHRVNNSLIRINRFQ